MGFLLLLCVCVFSCLNTVDCDDDDGHLIKQMQQIVKAWSAIWKQTPRIRPKSQQIKPQTSVQTLRRPKIDLSSSLSETAKVEEKGNNSKSISNNEISNKNQHGIKQPESTIKGETMSSNDLYKLIDSRMKEYKNNKKLMQQSTIMVNGKTVKASTEHETSKSSNKESSQSPVESARVDISDKDTKLQSKEREGVGNLKHMTKIGSSQLANGNSKTLEKPHSATSETEASKLLQETGLTWLGKSTGSKKTNKQSKLVKISYSPAISNVRAHEPQQPNLTTPNERNSDKIISNKGNTEDTVDSKSFPNVKPRKAKKSSNQKQTKPFFSVTFSDTNHKPTTQKSSEDKKQNKQVILNSGNELTKLSSVRSKVPKSSQGGINGNSITNQGIQVHVTSKEANSDKSSGSTKEDTIMAENSPVKYDKISSHKLSNAPENSDQISSHKLSNAPVNSGQIASHKLSNASVNSGQISSHKLSNAPVNSGQISSHKLSNAPVNSGQISSHKLSNAPANSGQIVSHKISNAPANSDQISSNKLSNAVGDRVVSSTSQRALDVTEQSSSAKYGQSLVSESENNNHNQNVHNTDSKSLSKSGVVVGKSSTHDIKHSKADSANHSSSTKKTDKSTLSLSNGFGSSTEDKQSKTSNESSRIGGFTNFNGGKVLSMNFKVQSIPDTDVGKKIVEQLLSQHKDNVNTVITEPETKQSSATALEVSKSAVTGNSSGSSSDNTHTASLDSTKSVNATEHGVVFVKNSQSAGFVDVDTATDPLKNFGKEQGKGSSSNTGIKNSTQTTSFKTTNDLLQNSLYHGNSKSLNSLKENNQKIRNYPSWDKQISANNGKGMHANNKKNRRTRPFPLRKMIDNMSMISQQKAPTKTDGEKTVLSIKRTRKPEGNTLIKQSITNFGNNRLLFNEFRKFKLKAKTRTRRSLLSSYAHINQQPDSPVTQFRNSYHTIVGLPKNGLVNIRYNSPTKEKKNNTPFDGSRNTLLRTEKMRRNRLIQRNNKDNRMKLKRQRNSSYGKTNSIKGDKRLHKKRHINRGWYQRISKTLSNGLPVFSKKKSLIHIIDSKPSAYKTKQTNLISSRKLRSKQYGKKQIYPMKASGPNGNSNTIKDRQNILGSYHRQQRTHIDSVASNAPRQFQVPNKKVDFISKQTVPQMTTSNQKPIVSKKYGNQITNKVPLNELKRGALASLHANDVKGVESKLSGNRKHKLNSVQPLHHLISFRDGRTVKYNLPDASRKNAIYTPQRHHDSISNVPKLLSGLSNIIDLAVENGYQIQNGEQSAVVLSKVNSPKRIVSDINTPHDIVINEFEKSTRSELPNAITLKDIKIVPGGSIINGKYYRYEDMPKFVQDFYDSKTKREHVKVSLSDVEHILNDYTDNKGSISQGFVRDFPMLKVIKGTDKGPFSIQNQVDNKAFDMLADPNLHEGSLELAMLHAKSLKAYDSKFKERHNKPHQDLYLKHKKPKSNVNHDMFHQLLKWSDGIPDKAGTGLGSLSDYNLGEEVRVGSSLSLGKSPPIVNKKRPQAPPSHFVAFKQSGERQILSLPLPAKTKYNNYVYGNLDNPSTSKIQQPDIKVPAYKTGKHALNVVQSRLGLTSVTSNQINQHTKGRGLKSATSNQINPRTRDQSYKNLSPLNVRVSKNANMFGNKRQFGKGENYLRKGNTKAVHVDKVRTQTFQIQPSHFKNAQLKDSFTSNVHIVDMNRKDTTAIYLNPKHHLFSGLKVTQKKKPNIPLRRINKSTRPNSITTNLHNFDQYNTRDYYGRII